MQAMEEVLLGILETVKAAERRSMLLEQRLSQVFFYMY
jgi:hypothetical protein